MKISSNFKIFDKDNRDNKRGNRDNRGVDIKRGVEELLRIKIRGSSI